MIDREEDIKDIRETFECECNVAVEYYECTKYCYSDCGCCIYWSDWENEHDISCPYFKKVKKDV